MKKTRFFVFITFAFMLTFGSCKKADAQTTTNAASVKSAGSKKSGPAAGYAGTPFNSDAYSEEAPEYKERNSLHLNTDSTNQVDYDSVNQFFTLDYTPEYPEHYIPVPCILPPKHTSQPDLYHLYNTPEPFQSEVRILRTAYFLSTLSPA